MGSLSEVLAAELPINLEVGAIVEVFFSFPPPKLEALKPPSPPERL